MKTKKIFLAVAAVGLLAGCSQKEDNPASQVDPNAVTTTTILGATTTTIPAGSGRQDHNIQDFWATGGTASLNVVDYPTLEAYTGRPMGTVSNIQLNVTLTNEGTTDAPEYGGDIKIGYDETDGAGNATFSFGEFNTDDGSAPSGSSNAQYNKFLTPTTYHGFFEDSYGALILVVDGTDDQNLLTGRVYFKNWNTNVCNTEQPGSCAPKSPLSCWFISANPSPYNCQDFLQGGKIVTTSSLYPSSYTLLGYFTGLSRSQAFGF